MSSTRARPCLADWEKKKQTIQKLRKKLNRKRYTMVDLQEELAGRHHFYVTISQLETRIRAWKMSKTKIPMVVQERIRKLLKERNMLGKKSVVKWKNKVVRQQDLDRRVKRMERDLNNPLPKLARMKSMPIVDQGQDGNTTPSQDFVLRLESSGPFDGIQVYTPSEIPGTPSEDTSGDDAQPDPCLSQADQSEDTDIVSSPESLLKATEDSFIISTRQKIPVRAGYDINSSSRLSLNTFLETESHKNCRLLETKSRLIQKEHAYVKKKTASTLRVNDRNASEVSRTESQLTMEFRSVPVITGPLLFHSSEGAKSWSHERFDNLAILQLQGLQFEQLQGFPLPSIKTTEEMVLLEKALFLVIENIGHNERTFESLYHLFELSFISGQPPWIQRCIEVVLSRPAALVESHLASATQADEDLIQLINILLEEGASVDASNNDGCTALQLAVSKGASLTARRLLQAGANVNACIPHNAPALIYNGVTPLHFAANLIDQAFTALSEMVLLLLDAGAEGHAVDDIGYTPLHTIIESQANFRIQNEQIELDTDHRISFLELRKSIPAKVQLFRSKRQCGCQSPQSCGPDCDEIAQAHATDAIGYTPLHTLIESQSKFRFQNEPMVLDVIDRLIKAAPSSLIYSGPKGETPLHVAAESGYRSAVRKLLEANSSTSLLSKKNHNGKTPLCLAIGRNHLDIIDMLLVADVSQSCASLLCGDEWGNTPLHLAALRGNHRVVAMILKHEMAILASLLAFRNNNGKTPLHLAVIYEAKFHEYNKNVQMLLASDPTRNTLNLADDEGNTPLHLAAGYGNLSTTLTLLKAGANPGLENKSGQLPEKVALVQNNPAIKDIILRWKT